MKKIPYKKLKALGLLHVSTRLFARYLDGPPGKFAEFWVGGIESNERYARVDGRLTDEWEKFVSHASFQTKRLLQFGVLFSTGEKWLCTGYMLSFFPGQLDRVHFTIDFASPWTPVAH